MTVEKVCLTHKVAIKTTEDDLKHMGPECITVESGGGLGEITPVTSETGREEEGLTYESGVIMPFDTDEEKKARRRILGIPEPKTSETK
jgi:hypothetical protein